LLTYDRGHDFSRAILGWWRENGRQFPWRITRDSYSIIVSEVLLHRTRADQVVPVYRSLLKKFPTIEDLASASIDDVRAIVGPLGLHWRTQLLHEMVKELTSDYDGNIPTSMDRLMLLPGVSDYISAAVRLFAFGFPEPLLDVNTVRILGRVFGLKTTDGSRRSAEFRRRYDSVMDTQRPREFGYAMIDLGAVVCTARNPKCAMCPLNSMCCFVASVGGRAE
jgi:A/G-specific adenine glycosylase